MNHLRLLHHHQPWGRMEQEVTLSSHSLRQHLRVMTRKVVTLFAPSCGCFLCCFQLQLLHGTTKRRGVDHAEYRMIHIDDIGSSTWNDGTGRPKHRAILTVKPTASNTKMPSQPSQVINELNSSSVVNTEDKSVFSTLAFLQVASTSLVSSL